ncbi:MAG: class I tRNA ligase family protein, partial [Pseudomonadota bacterium]|nr:class I tRNA ligase family protein [Pseudomonadota bacterium]
GAHGVPLANVWMHCGALRVGDDKMSKSLGNVMTIREALKKYDAEVLRFFLLRPHYRSQIAFTESLIDEARTALTRLYLALRDNKAPEQVHIDWTEAHARRFADAMNDDFNTPIALAALFDLASEINRSGSTGLAAQLRALGSTLGLLQQEPTQFLRGTDDDTAGIELLISVRATAKKEKNYGEADRVRKALLDKGVVLEDTADGTTWRRR